MTIENSIKYFEKEYNINIDNNSIASTKNYILQILQTTRTLNKPSLDIEITKAKIKQRIAELEASYVTGDSYDGVMGGHNNGLIPNIVEKKYLKKLELEEKLNMMIDASIEQDIKLETINNHARNIINLTCNQSPDTIDTLVCYYIHCKSMEYISDMSNTSLDAIYKRKNRGISNISKTIYKLSKNV